MNHTYFLEPLTWVADGAYYDDSGNTYPLCGEVKIERNAAIWTLQGYLEVQFDKPVRFTNNYTITQESPCTLRWESYNPALGMLRGTFELFGDAIMSHYTSTDGVYSGAETLLQKSAETYENTGVSFQNGRRLSAWTATLRAKRS